MLPAYTGGDSISEPGGLGVETPREPPLSTEADRYWYVADTHADIGELPSDVWHTSDARKIQGNFARCDGDYLASTFARCLKAPPGIESLGYLEPDTKQYLEFLEGTGRLRRGRRRSGSSLVSRRWCRRVSRMHIGFQRWILLVVVGVLAGLIAVIVSRVMHYLFAMRFFVGRLVMQCTDSLVLLYLSFVALSVALAAVAGYLVCFCEVLSAGSGIPEIKCFLNGIRCKDVVCLRTLLCKSVGISFSVSAGLPCGKEGPMIHSGAIIGGMLARNHALKEVFPLRLAREQRDMVAAGAAAGVAAAFNAPLGGVLFAIEEGASHMNPDILLRLFVCCASAAFTSRFLLSGLEGHPWFHMGKSVPVEFGRFTKMDYQVPDIFFFALIGVGGGVAGGIFVELNKRLSLWRQRWIGACGMPRFCEVLLVTVAISSIQFWLVTLQNGGAVAPILEPAGNSTEGHSEASDEPEAMEDILLWLPGASAMKILFHSEKHIPVGHCFSLAVVSYLTSCWTYGLGVPSGLFVPSLLTGAAFGRALGETASLVMEMPMCEICIWSLVGAVSMLAGTARITISLAVIIMESTGDAVFGIPLFLATLAAKWTGAYFGHGIYDMHIIEMKRIPLLEYLPPRQMIGMSVRGAMSVDVVCVESVETVGRLVDVLNSCDHHGFPVLYPGTRQLAGMIERRTIRSVLRTHGEFESFQPPEGRLSESAPMVPYAVEQWHFHECPEYELQKDDEEKRVDLAPYVDRCGYSIAETASLMSCFCLFRQLGLRHLPVVDRTGDVRGIITRKDLILAEGAEHGVSAEDLDDEGSLSDSTSEQGDDGAEHEE